MTPEEFIEKLDRVASELPDFIQNRFQGLILDAKALVQNRIQEEGQNSEGENFPPYTPEYQRWKQKQGKYRGKVDFTLTGEMFRSMGVVRNSKTNSTVTVSLGGRDQFTQAKIDSNSARRGDILRLNKEEEKLIVESFDNDFQGFINEIFE